MKEIITNLLSLVGLISAAGGGAIATYIWQRTKRKLEAKTLESRVEVAISLANLPAPNGDKFSSFQEHAQYAYSYTAYVSAIKDLALQIHSISRVKTYIWASFWIFSALILGIGGVVIVYIVAKQIILWIIAVCFIVILLSGFAAQVLTKHSVSLSGLNASLLKASSSKTVQYVVQKAMDGEVFYEKKRYRWIKLSYYEPKILDSSSSED